MLSMLVTLKNIYMFYKKYVGESKIIYTIGTCFAVGCTAGWS
jgi:hypothetical protein